MQLSVAHPVIMEVPALLLVHVPVLLNGLGPLVQLVRLRVLIQSIPSSHPLVLVESDVDYRTR